MALMSICAQRPAVIHSRHILIESAAGYMHHSNGWPGFSRVQTRRGRGAKMVHKSELELKAPGRAEIPGLRESGI